MSIQVAIKNLSKRYVQGGAAVDALSDVSLQIEAGDIFGLLGPNGAGKTTLLECISGLRQADTGDISLGGIDPRREPEQAKAQLGVVLQQTALQAAITPQEALTLFGSLYPSSYSAAELLERFSLTEKANARFETLSAGQRQRLALALAFLNKPKLVLLDEPTNGLDPHARRELHDEIRGLQRAGVTVLLSTHYLEEAEQLCNRIAILDRGRVTQVGSPNELIAAASSSRVIALVADAPLEPAKLEQLPHVQELECAGVKVTLRTSNGVQTLAVLLRLLAADNIGIVDLQVRQATLEEAFIDLTKGSRDPGAGAVS